MCVSVFLERGKCTNVYYPFVILFLYITFNAWNWIFMICLTHGWEHIYYSLKLSLKRQTPTCPHDVWCWMPAFPICFFSVVLIWDTCLMMDQDPQGNATALTLPRWLSSPTTWLPLPPSPQPRWKMLAAQWRMKRQSCERQTVDTRQTDDWACVGRVQG